MTDDDKIAIAARHGFDVHGGRAFAWPGQREVTANLFYALDAAFAAGVREGLERAAVPLTDEQAMEMWCKRPVYRQYVEAYMAGIRDAERAHGITTKESSDD